MADIIDLRVEKALRTSGLKDKELVQDIIDQGYDPCNPLDLHNYYEWKKFENLIYTDLSDGTNLTVEHNWTDEAIDRLMADVKTWNETDNTTTTVSFNPKLFE